jgi:pimeloyl-ACP methyl ester carboxylesterase
MYSQSKELWSELAGSPVEVVPGSGHYIQTERPEAVIEAIEATSKDIRALSKTP